MTNTIPKLMKAIRQDKIGGELYVTDVPVPQPQKGEVLVKMHASPINPSDLSFLKGTFNEKPNYPVTPGIEGSGLVVASGGGLLANLRKGKFVACSSTEGMGGTWAEYMLTSAMRVIPLKKGITPEQGAMLIVNPMTAMAFITIAKMGKHKAIVNNAAASALGKMLIKLCSAENIELINIVRRKEQAEQLKMLGAEHILDSSSSTFNADLKTLSNKLNATLFFDAIGGKETGQLVDTSPMGSTIMLYANLSNKDVQFSTRTLLQQNKKIDGFSLGNWSASRSIIQSLKTANTVQKLAKYELSTTIHKQFKLLEVNEAINFYSENMTRGKVLFKF